MSAWPRPGGKEDPLATDDDGDGVSENAGDCNDANPNVRPNGPVSFAIDFAFTGTVDCSTRNSRAQTYRITNNSCSAVTVNSLTASVRYTSGTNCALVGRPATTTSLAPSVSTVQPGATTVIRTGAAAGSSFPGLCCRERTCTTGSCALEEAYTAATSAGSFSASNSYMIAFPQPTSCPGCSGVFDPRVRFEGGEQPPSCQAGPYR